MRAIAALARNASASSALLHSYSGGQLEDEANAPFSPIPLRFLCVSVSLRGKSSICFNSSYNRTVREDHHVAKDRSPKKEVKKPKKKK